MFKHKKTIAKKVNACNICFLTSNSLFIAFKLKVLCWLKLWSKRATMTHMFSTCHLSRAVLLQQHSTKTHCFSCSQNIDNHIWKSVQGSLINTAQLQSLNCIYDCFCMQYLMQTILQWWQLSCLHVTQSHWPCMICPTSFKVSFADYRLGSFQLSTCRNLDPDLHLQRLTLLTSGCMLMVLHRQVL